jgi:hypothetical protein
MHAVNRFLTCLFLGTILLGLNSCLSEGDLLDDASGVNTYDFDKVDDIYDEVIEQALKEIEAAENAAGIVPDLVLSPSFPGGDEALTQ